MRLPAVANLGPLLRATALAIAALASVATSRSRPASTTPTGTEPPAGAVPGIYWCHTMRSSANTSSVCYAEYARCERERQQEAAEGLFTMYCQQVSPVACFQLGADPNPSQEMCAQTVEDCELWRTIDKDKNGQSGDACSWRH